MLLTVFTPTYNRIELLPRLYESLKRQTSRDFTWLIVDDGSTDGTEKLINDFAREGVINIEYHYRENGGKMRAHNDGVRYCATKYFLCLDSDDYLVDDAVESLLSKALDIDEKIAGIVAHKGKSETELLSDVNFPEVNKSSLYNLYLNGFKGETTLMFVTDVIKKFPFPEIENEKYVPEDYIYDKIDVEYEYVVFDKIITVCEIVKNGYTDSVKKLKENNKTAFYLYYEQRAIITPASLLKIKYSGFYVKFARMCGRNVFDTKLNKAYVLIGILASVFIK